jgi:hypothetical protein
MLAGTGKSAEDGVVGRMLASVDRSKPVYFATAAFWSAATGPLPEMKHVAGTLDVSAGLAVDLSLVCADAKGADLGAKSLTKMLADTRNVIVGLGAPAPVLETVTFDAKGDTVVAHASATPDELERIVTELEEHL